MAAQFSEAKARSTSRRLEWWHYAAIVLLIGQAVTYVVLQLRPGTLGVVCWYLAADPILWWGLTAILAMGAGITAILRRTVMTPWRLIGAALLALVALSPLTYQAYPSSHDDQPSQIRFRLPLDGPITVAWGGASAAVNYHVIAPDQRWAYDLVVTKAGETFEGSEDKPEDYFCYGQPVLAPAAGIVRATYTDAREMPVGMLGGEPAGGNQVVLEVAPRQFLFLCHLQPGSILVQPGDRVTAGQPLARVGNTGNTSEPHLHIHLQDTSDDGFAEGIPLYFHGYRADGRPVERGLPTGGIRHGRFVGQIVEHIP